jgi:hypothetical protein
MNMIRYIWSSDSKIDKAPNKMAIARRIRKRITIRSAKLYIELHRSLNSAFITKSSTSKEILDILFLGDIKSIISGGNLNPKKVAKRTKISHKKLLTKTGLNKQRLHQYSESSSVMIISSTWRRKRVRLREEV